MTPRPSVSAAALLLAVVATEASAQTWTFLTPAPYPTLLARRSGGMAFDPIQGKVLMYGGTQSGPTLALNDTWTFDGATWTQMFPTASANARAFYSMAFDERRGKVVMYGTQSGSTIGTLGGNQTWEYDGTTWAQATPAFVPPGLELPAMVYDKGRGVTVMFGGFNGTLPGTDYRNTWEFDGTNWVDRGVLPNAPLTGHRTACVYDDVRGRVVLYGGYASATIQQKVWEYDGNDWTLVLSGSGPGKITEGYAAYSPITQQTYYFGGSGPTVVGTVNNETWLYDGAKTAIAAKFGQACASSAGTPDLAPTTTPVLGTNYVLTLSNGAFHGIGVIAHGFSNTNSVFGLLPQDLTSVGFGGCRLEVSTDASLLLLVNSGTATNTIGFPNDPGLAGIPLFSQVLVLDALAPNGNGGVSNAVHGVLGS